MKGKFYSFYSTDADIIRFLDDFKSRKENRNRFIADLLWVAKRCRDQMGEAIATVEPLPLQPSKPVERVCEQKQLDQNEIIKVINQSLQDWKGQKKTGDSAEAQRS